MILCRPVKFISRFKQLFLAHHVITFGVQLVQHKALRSFLDNIRNVTRSIPFVYGRTTLIRAVTY